MRASVTDPTVAHGHGGRGIGAFIAVMHLLTVLMGDPEPKPEDYEPESVEQTCGGRGGGLDTVPTFPDSFGAFAP